MQGLGLIGAQSTSDLEGLHTNLVLKRLINKTRMPNVH